MIKKEKPFVGNFKEMLENFIKFKRNLGYKYVSAYYSLQKFSEYSLNYKSEDNSLSKELVIGWTTKKKDEAIKTWERRVSGLRQFALYLQSQGFDAFIPLKSCNALRSEYIPYIFTHEEIKCLFQVIDSIPPHPLSNKNESYPLLFRLLYCCGLRISEAINLKINDVNFDSAVLLIRESKFNKDRLVPMSESLADMFVKYQALFNVNKSPEDYYFRNKNDTCLTYGWVYKVFRKLLWKARISHRGRGKGPRLHDIRHSFCVHTLAEQVKKGVDMYITLPILSAYIGHNSVEATQRYVRLTAEAFPELIEKISRTCAYVIPEVTKNETN